MSKSANGLKGTLLRSEDDWFFRVYDKMSEEGFKDYTIWHNDLKVIIADSDAFIYENKLIGDFDGVLDHSPEILGIEE